jgi:hypothetical protein
LEPVAPAWRRQWILVAINTTELAKALHELIEALDRRVPRVSDAGETAIARDAALLRAKAVDRLAELKRSQSSPSAESGTARSSTRE